MLQFRKVGELLTGYSGSACCAACSTLERARDNQLLCPQERKLHIRATHAAILYTSDSNPFQMLNLQWKLPYTISAFQISLVRSLPISPIVNSSTSQEQTRNSPNLSKILVYSIDVSRSLLNPHDALKPRAMSLFENSF